MTAAVAEIVDFLTSLSDEEQAAVPGAYERVVESIRRARSEGIGVQQPGARAAMTGPVLVFRRPRPKSEAALIAKIADLYSENETVKRTIDGLLSKRVRSAMSAPRGLRIGDKLQLLTFVNPVGMIDVDKLVNRLLGDSWDRYEEYEERWQQPKRNIGKSVITIDRDGDNESA